MKIVVVFGGKSVEHEISIISAFQVIEILKTKYEVLAVYASKSNEFYYNKNIDSIEAFKKSKYRKRDRVEFVNNNGFYIKGKRKKFFDLIFPIVHGKGVEDGTLLSYFRFKGFDIIGENHSFYSVSQNKYLTKRVLDGLNVTNTRYRMYTRDDEINCDINFPVILKPNNLGSSIGIVVVNNEDELKKGVKEILKIDDMVLVEEYLQDSREFSVSLVDNNGTIEVSKVEEVKKSVLYSFSDKYLSNGKKKGMNFTLKSSFEIEKEITNEIEIIAKKIYKEFGASGVIRVDFLYKDSILYVNEINSIPGSYAYYLWEDKYDFLELLEIVIKGAKRYLFFINKQNAAIQKEYIFEGLNNY